MLEVSYNSVDLTTRVGRSVKVALDITPLLAFVHLLPVLLAGGASDRPVADSTQSSTLVYVQSAGSCDGTPKHSSRQNDSAGDRRPGVAQPRDPGLLNPSRDGQINDPSLVLSAGEQAHVGADEGGLKLQRRPVELAEVNRMLQWREGRVAFNGQSLAQVVEEFNRYNREQLVVADETLAVVKIEGSFRATDIQGLLAFLHHRHGIVARRLKNSDGRADVIQLARPGTAP
jgi:hypothetical protein